MHYTPNGTAQKDRSYVGFVFADPKTVKKEVAVQNAGNFTFKIPPGDPNYEVESEFVFRQKTVLLTISPHMHLRGKDFRYDLIYPDGKQETLLWVPRYDFGWQTTYQLAEPKRSAEGHEDALRRPLRQLGRQPGQSRSDARKSRWGEQTWEEMMFGWFEMSLADQDLTQPATASALRVKEFLAQADTIRVDDQLKAMARGSLKNDKTFERFVLAIVRAGSATRSRVRHDGRERQVATEDDARAAGAEDLAPQPFDGRQDRGPIAGRLRPGRQDGRQPGNGRRPKVRS